MADVTQAMRDLKRYSTLFTKQEYKTIKGQILSGDIIAAYRGMLKLIQKKGY